MEVYLEYAFLNNLFLDWLLAYCTDKIIRRGAKKWRLWLSAVVGSVGAIAISLIKRMFWGIFARIISLLLVVSVAFFNKSTKSIFKPTLVFLALTYLLGGVIFGLFYFFEVDLVDALKVYGLANLPFGAIGFGVLFFCLTVKCVVNYAKTQKKLKNFGCTVTFDLFGKKNQLQGLFDSGNSLVQNGIPVCFLCLSKQNEKIKNAVLQSVVSGNPPKNLQYVDFFTVDGKAQALAFEAEDFCINGVKRQALLAFGKAAGVGFDVLVNFYLTEE